MSVVKDGGKGKDDVVQSETLSQKKNLVIPAFRRQEGQEDQGLKDILANIDSLRLHFLHDLLYFFMCAFEGLRVGLCI